MGIKKKMGEEDQILRFAVIAVVLLFVIGIVIVAMKLMNPRVDASEGTKKLTELGAADVSAVDARIQELEQAEMDAALQWQEKSASEKLEGCLIIGDSVSQGLYQYELVDKTLVLTKDGAGVYDPDGTGLTELIAQAVEAAPSKIFLALGVLDTDGNQADADTFAENYKNVIHSIKEALPNTFLYINSGYPVSREAKVTKHNQELRALCLEEGVIFIDNTSLVKEEYYIDDGIHMSQDYYSGWLDHMLEAGFRRNGIQ